MGKGKRIGRKSAIQGWKRVSEPLKGGAEMKKMAVKRRETKKRPAVVSRETTLLPFPLPAVIMKRGVNPLGGW